MNRRLAAVLTLVAFGALARISVADDKKSAEMSAQEKAMMEAWAKYATPGEAHKKMAALEGSWIAKVTQWMAPGAPANESAGTSEFKSILGGRYLTQSFSSTMMGQPFSGFGISGYDNAKKTTQSVWTDTFGTGMLIMSGSWGADGALTESGSMDDFMTGKPMTIKTRMQISDNDHMHYEMWMPAPDGKMFKDLDIVYTRVK
ncbi:MAG: DUF1579 domain-containing protein [Thermoanaerobaculia bacterium]